MDAATTYLLIVLGLLVSVIVSAVLLYLGYRIKKEQIFLGYRERSKDEKYTGYALLGVGGAIIALSIFELLSVLLEGGAGILPFGLTNMFLFGQVIAAEIPAFILATSFWLILLVFGGRKIFMLGLDLLKGKQVKFKRSIR